MMWNAASSPPTSLKQHSTNYTNSKDMMMDETEKLKIEIQTNKLKAENEALLLNQQIQELKFRNEAANMQVAMEKLKVENVSMKLKDVTLENEKLKETHRASGGAVSTGEKVEQLKDDHKRKDNEIKSKDSEIKSKDDEIKAKESEIKARDDEIKSRDGLIKNKDNEIKSKDSEIKSKDDEIKAKESEIKARDDEIKARDGEIKNKDNEIKALKMKIGASSTNTNHHNNGQTLFITDEMYFTEGVQRFIQGLSTRTNIYSSYDVYYKFISHKMQNNLISPNTRYPSFQPFAESYEVPYYQYNKCLFVKMECQDVTNIQFDISWLEYEHFTYQKEVVRIAREQPAQPMNGMLPTYTQTHISTNRGRQQNTILRNDRLVDRNWSHSGCTVLLLHKTDPMKCVQLSPQFKEPGYRSPGFGTTTNNVQQNYNQMGQCKIEEQNKLYGGVWQANLSSKRKAEYFSFNREVYNVGSKSDLYFCVICCIKNI